MKKNIHGGKRSRSGRKPVDDPKKGITIYIHQSIVEKNGGEEICKIETVNFLTKRAVRQKKKNNVL